MMRPLLLLTCLLHLAAAAAAQDVAAALASVVRISGTRGETPVRGSGFVVAVSGGVATVVTASHVIEGARFEVAFAAATDRFPVDAADVLGMDRGPDLAVFLVRGAIPAGVASLDFDVESRPRAAESLLLVGFPQSSRTPLTKSRNYSGRRGTLLLLDLPVGEGFSGGPVVRDGKVVGVVTDEDPQLTYAVNALVAREFVLGSGIVLCRFGEERAFEGIEFVRVCAGIFTMGSADDDELVSNNEKPAHRVTLSEFWIGKYEITNEQYRRFRAAHEGDADLPATQVSWNDAKAFCESFGFRLPTEAEWEYAARAGTQTAWSFGDDESEIGRYAWYDEDFSGPAHPVGKKRPNDWGLHDMHGNVWEWVADWYGPYSKEPQSDPTGPTAGDRRVMRGGSFNRLPEVLRSALRVRGGPEFRNGTIGFRCVRRPRRQP